ncbi:uncharacterized protein LOC122426740 [Cervus canadensis]|uniref:uncharacterized protein LOC122426740 n=1 Tax=Cervus canadensis TaxID=1574408 RepID=UPI001CA3335B|nr:uncharacterized protein LOC122426740 [Cervus canadensis]
MEGGKAVSVAGSLISHYLLLTTPPRPHPGRPRGSPRGGTESPASSFRSAKPARAPRGVPEGARAHGRSFARGWRVALPEPGAPGHTPGPEPGSTGSARGGALGGGTCRTRARGGAGAARPPGLCRAATSRVVQEGRTTARLDSTWSGHHCLTRRRSQQLTPHPSDLIPTSTGFPGSPGHKTSPGLLRVPHPMDHGLVFLVCSSRAICIFLRRTSKKLNSLFSDLERRETQGCFLKSGDLEELLLFWGY